MRVAAGVWARAAGAARAVAAKAAIDVMTLRREMPQVQFRPAVSAHANELRFACRMDESPCFLVAVLVAAFARPDHGRIIKAAMLKRIDGLIGHEKIDAPAEQCA